MERRFELLTDKERNDLSKTPETGFIPAFVEWAAMKTDASRYALEAAALQALSLAAGDTVVLPPFFGSTPTYLNLYVMLVGPSTTMRKTTVLNFVRDLLPVNEMTGQPYIKIMDDVSIQAFSRETADAGNTMSPVLFNVDEVAGLFQLVRNKSGSYLAGFDKTLLKVYDHTPITIHRVGRDVKNEVGAFVNIFAATTPEPLLEVLDGDDVESGLLPRFIIFDIRDALRGERRSLMQRLNDQEKWEDIKKELQRHLADIATNRACGKPAGQRPDGSVYFDQTTLALSPEALARLDDLDHKFHDEIIGDTSAVGAIKGRAFWQTVKLSGLYALSRAGKNARVEYIDVLRALFTIEATVDDLLRMKEEIGSNVLERRILAVEEMLRNAPNKTMKVSTIMRRLKLSQIEGRELGGTLQMRGHILAEKDSKQQFHWTWLT